MAGYIIVALLTFGAVFMATVAVMRPRQPQVRRRLGIDELEAQSKRELQGSFAARNIKPALARFGGRLALLLPKNLIGKVEHMLVAANSPWSLQGFVSAWAISGSIGLVLALYALLTAQSLSLSTLMFAGMVVGLAVLAPFMMLRRRMNARQKLLTQDLPDALDLLVTCVEAGMSIDASFVMVAEKSKGPLAEVLAHYLRQVTLGRPRREALLDVAEQSGARDLIMMASAVSQGEQLGTPISDVLRNQSEDLRIRRRQRAEMAAQKAPVMMSVPLVLCFMPAMATVVVVPSIINLILFVGG